ncbi:hypothetical protein DYB25_003285 [Aphanomyces astaci]|uniref:Aspartyl/asparaginy/proline hydroxylase domain-containing protein n=1 Tax=Aphanomyces astaci TaxID=112090 RepID=A0A396ZP57_APHAT|nr:hypothetical protein DYB25_003285 [Aphanomyces astaci]
MASCELTLEELLPEVANVFAIHESALFNCMSILSTTITRHEEESKSKASAADIAQVRGDVKKATEFFGDSKKMIQRLEKTQECLLAELSDLRQENASKDTALAALERQQEQHMAAYEQHLEELDRRFEYISRMKSEQKDVAKRLEIQERSYAELKFGMAMLAKSIGDDTGEAAPILPLVPLVPVSGRNSNSDHRSMKHIMSTAHLRRPTLAAVAAITAVSQGSASNVAPLDPMMAPMSRKASISKLNDHLSDRNSSDKSVLVDVTTAVLVRQGSTLFKKAPSMALLPPSPNASAPPPDLTDTSIQMSRRMSERSDSYRVESADALSEVALLDEVTQTLVASAVQSPPGLVTDASANFVDGMADQYETTLKQEHEADVGALLEPTMVPGGVAGGLAPNDPARRVGETEAGGASSANAPQEPAHLEPVGSAATAATTSGMMRSHAEYKYLWHWAYSNVIALYRMHDTVGSRVRQIEDTMDAVHDSLDDMRAKVDGLDAVHSDLEHIKVSTTEVVEQVASLQIVSSQTEANTQHLQDQLQATTKTELQAITANLTTQAQVWEKELGKLADDGRKNAADHKRQADDAAAHVNAVVGRLYEWVHFLGDALHVACCTDNPADSAPYRRLADVKDRDVDKYMGSGMAPLALLLDTLSQATSDDPAANSHRTALVRLVRETLVEAKGVACVALLFARFGAVHTKAAALATALDVIKTMSAKVEYVVNNTQMMIVEDDLNKVVARLSDEREQLRADVDTSVKQLFAVSSELEASLEREVTALASRLHTKIDRDEVGMAQQTMQGELERLAHDVVSHDEFVVLSERLKRKPDSNDIRAYVRQKISTLKLQQTEANTDAPLLGSVPVRCISCQNVVEAKAQPVVLRDDKPQRDVLPFTTSSVRHVQKHKLEAMLRAKGALKLNDYTIHRDKRRPSEVLIAEDPSIELVCATTRSTTVDVSKLQEALLALPEERWSEAYQTKHNVSLRRPFHDKVGVNKIISIFSDNHLEHVYLLPEWTHWQPLVLPIFEHLDIPLDRVVRCLFARMPPNTLIPPHHDNGPWVARTHRIHVPLVTFPEVEFKSGRDEATMQRYAFNVGTVVELNNAAKHSVFNGASGWRIHMIFDVLEQIGGHETDTLPTVTTLNAGQLCRQVRGRVELVTDVQQTSTEAATQVARELLAKLKTRLPKEHGDALGTGIRHFFIEQITAPEFASVVRRHCPDAMQGDVLEVLRSVDAVMADEAAAALRADESFGPSYCILGVQKCGTTSLFRHCKYLLSLQVPLEMFDPASMLLADSTPSYLLYGAPVALRMRQLLPSVRFIVMLRNPIERAYSQYHMTADPTGTPHQLEMRKVVQGKSFQDVINEDLARLQAVQADPTSISKFQEYADALPQDHGSHSYLGRGLYALQLRIWLEHFPRSQFLILNVDNMDTPVSTQATLDDVCTFLRLPPFTLRDAARQNTREYPPMSDAVRDQLRAFYAPHNAALADLLPEFTFSWS